MPECFISAKVVVFLTSCKKSYLLFEMYLVQTIEEKNGGGHTFLRSIQMNLEELLL